MRRLLRGQAGISTIEMTVAAGILVAVMAMVMPLVTTSFNLLGEHESRASVDADLQIAMRQLTRDVRSGNVVGAPFAVGGKTAMGVRIYTQTNGVPFRCVEYQVNGATLRRRDRDPADSWTESWQTIATNLTNAVTIPTKDAFTRSADKSTLTIKLLMDPRGSGRPVESNVAITGRNTKYYDTPFAESTCA
jgi:hypothetical protein